MQNVVCNIPHAGMVVPDWALPDFCIALEEIHALADFMADKDVDKLYDFVPAENKNVATLSRIVLDMERFRNDEDEPMSRLGMGLFYTCDHLGNTIRRKGASFERCLSVYDAYHAELEAKVMRCLAENGSCVVLDCHSFHDAMAYTGYEPEEFPDVCVGFNEAEAPEEAEWVRALFERNGYQVKMNMPFSGSLVPLRYFGDPRVKTIMIELNRRIYCHSAEDFEKCRRLCKEVYAHFCQ